jgi:hypothetical protein
MFFELSTEIASLIFYEMCPLAEDVVEVNIEFLKLLIGSLSVIEIKILFQT